MIFRTENNMENRQNDPFPDAPKGVGGWLKFFIIILGVFNPIFSLMMTVGEFQSVEQENPALLHVDAFVHYKWFSWGVLLVCCILCIDAAYRLWKKHIWKSVKQAVLTLWIVGPLASAIVSAYICINFGTGAEGQTAAIGGAIFRSLIFAGIWTAYLLRSKRVRNTYPKEENLAG